MGNNSFSIWLQKAILMEHLQSPSINVKMSPLSFENRIGIFSVKMIINYMVLSRMGTRVNFLNMLKCLLTISLFGKEATVWPLKSLILHISKRGGFFSASSKIILATCLLLFAGYLFWQYAWFKMFNFHQHKEYTVMKMYPRSQINFDSTHI